MVAVHLAIKKDTHIQLTRRQREREGGGRDTERVYHCLQFLEANWVPEDWSSEPDVLGCSFSKLSSQKAGLQEY